MTILNDKAAGGMKKGICNNHRQLSVVNANLNMSIFGEMKCHFSPVSIQWLYSLDYPSLAGLKPVKS